MSPEDVHKLLGGYATGTLTAEEQQALFEAALQDQELFDTLVREQTLRDVLGDPAARAQLLAAIDDVPSPWYRRFWRPVPIAALAAGLAAAAIMAFWQGSRTPRPVRMAKLPAMQRTQEAPSPMLPPPPELAQASRPVLAPFTLPGAVPPAATPALSVQTKSEALSSVTLDRGLPLAQGFRGNSTFGQNSLTPMFGTVTDPSGAAIRSATVEIKSLTTGDVVKTSTNERGEFNAAQVAGRPYQISASAAGFQSATVNNVIPTTGAPVNLRLGVGADNDTLSVTSAAASGGGRQQGQQGGGSLGGVAGRRMAVAEAPAPAALTLQCRVMRQTPGGDLVEVPEGGTVAAGATLFLQITPNATGYVLIRNSNGQLIVNRAVRATQRFDTPLPAFDKPGRVELQALFSRNPFEPGATIDGKLSSGFAPAAQSAVTITLTIQ